MLTKNLVRGRRYRRPGLLPGPASDCIEVVSVGRKWLRFRPVIDGKPDRRIWQVAVRGWPVADWKDVTDGR